MRRRPTTAFASYMAFLLKVCKKLNIVHENIYLYQIFTYTIFTLSDVKYIYNINMITTLSFSHLYVTTFL